MNKSTQQIQSILMVALIGSIALAGGEYFVSTKLDVPEIVMDPEKYRVQHIFLRMFYNLSILPRILPPIVFIAFASFFDVRDRFGKRKEFFISTKAYYISILIFSGCFILNILTSAIHPLLFKYLTPILYLTMLITGMVIGFKNRILFVDKYGVHNDKMIRKSEFGITLNLSNNLIKGYANVMNLNHGSIVIGNGGAGKTRSIFVPIIQDTIGKKNFTGFIYDYKFKDPEGNITRWVVKTFRDNKITDRKLYIVNFTDLRKCHRFNAIKPVNLPRKEYSYEYASAFIQNMDKEYVKKLDFWGNSAYSLVASIMWFLKKNEPSMCTIPHMTSIILTSHKKVMNLLSLDGECSDMIMSTLTGREEEAGNQIAGIFASLQVPMGKISNPTMYWVLSGDDFDLDLNNPKNPAVLCMGNDSDLKTVYSPVIGLTGTVISKRLNNPGCLPSHFMVDELYTCFFPGIEELPNVARSNGVCVTAGVQDLPLLIDSLGAVKTDVFLASLSNFFFGKVNNPETIKKAVELMGKEEVEYQTKSRSISANSKGGGSSTSYSTNFRDRDRISSTDIRHFRRGEFVGALSDVPVPFFKGKVILKDLKKNENSDPNFIIDNFVDFEDRDIDEVTQLNYERIKLEVKSIFDKYNC